MHTVSEIKSEAIEKRWGSFDSTVVLTEERIGHILNRHSQDFQKYSYAIPMAIESPTYILEDIKNPDTAMFIKELDGTNINVVVKIALGNVGGNLHSSVITMYQLGSKTLKRMIKKNPMLYKAPEP